MQLPQQLRQPGAAVSTLQLVAHTVAGPMLQDLAYIDWLVSLHPGVYRKRTPRRKQNATDYDGLWEGLQPDRFYVKVGVMEQAHGLHGTPRLCPCLVQQAQQSIS